MANYSELSGKVAVISGGGGNLGMAVAKRFWAEDTRLVLIDRNQDAVKKGLLERQIDPNQVMIGVVDLTQKGEVDPFIDKVVANYGQVDILVNTAGGFRSSGPVHEMDEGLWDFMFGLNAKTTYLLSAAVARVMVAKQIRGRIINIGSRSALKTEPYLSAYGASKAAVLRLTESMAAELQVFGITVNAILPSVIDTPPNRRDNPNADYSRWVAPESLADVIAFLASEGARDISGAALPVFGRA